jgi:2-methylaconitate cis-trans-isomerase PrpF
MIDAGAPMVLVEAASLGLTGSESLAEMSQHVPLLTSNRSAAAVQMGLREADSPVDHAVPKVGVVGAARDYITAGGKRVAATEYDVAVRTLSMHAPHPAIGLTSAVGLTTAAITPGTIVHSAITRNLRKTADGATVLQIGTAAGPIITTVTTDPANGGTRIGLQRAARIISESILFTREFTLEAAAISA